MKNSLYNPLVTIISVIIKDPKMPSEKLTGSKTKLEGTIVTQIYTAQSESATKLLDQLKNRQIVDAQNNLGQPDSMHTGNAGLQLASQITITINTQDVPEAG